MPNISDQTQILDNILYDFDNLLNYYNIEKPIIDIKFPYVTINNFKINVESFEYEGEEDELTDAFRDFLRKRGIRIYTNRGFSFKLKRK